MIGLLTNEPINIAPGYLFSMSNTLLLFSRRIEHMLHQHAQEVSLALNEAHEAFSMQHLERDGVRFQQACQRLGQFLDLVPPLGKAAQNILVQILQLACAMHENAIDDPMLTGAQRRIHRRASCDLSILFKKALDEKILSLERSWEVYRLCERAERSLSTVKLSDDVYVAGVHMPPTRQSLLTLYDDMEYRRRHALQNFVPPPRDAYCTQYCHGQSGPHYGPGSGLNAHHTQYYQSYVPGSTSGFRGV